MLLVFDNAQLIAERFSKFIRLTIYLSIWEAIKWNWNCKFTRFFLSTNKLRLGSNYLYKSYKRGLKHSLWSIQSRVSQMVVKGLESTKDYPPKSSPNRLINAVHNPMGAQASYFQNITFFRNRDVVITFILTKFFFILDKISGIRKDNDSEISNKKN